MIIKSKRTGVEQTIDREMWAKMQSLDMSRNWLIISNEDVIRIAGEIKIPVEVTEFQKKRNERKRITKLHSDEAVQQD